MRIVIVGCGRVGSGLARELSLLGHAICVVDPDPERLERLGSSFKGQTVIGIGFDRGVLVRAGIERSDGFAAVTPSDEINVVAARMASQVFQVPKVVARVYDPRKSETYRRLGVLTIDQVTWGIHSIADMLVTGELDTMFSLGSEVQVVKADLPQLLIGRSVKELTVPAEVSVISIERRGETFLPAENTLFEHSDVLFVAVRATSMGRLHELLALR